ncbi:Uncharacterised protein [Enterobacter hormaechei]|jgi:hypothetical protein|uniref:hypothetical protein n=1 Tax=Enterobacteriaceae TaxID=543 RepID=UPI001256A6C5|nr:hypothetical protein [Enterobacter hormaechei]MDV1811059.1 hypothetical protein [Enterobacter hormaechei]MDV1903638.1 hypothetical protein [Enterobacter hormaechei]VAC84220.1 Uncharacterised protein [Enterobacter hormaechei]
MMDKITTVRLLHLLSEFSGAGEDARSIDDNDYAQECEDVAAIIREVLVYRECYPSMSGQKH